MLDQAFDLLDPPKRMPVTLRKEPGGPAVVLVDLAREAAPDLVIGSRGGDFVARTLPGSVAELAVPRVPCDLGVVA